MQTITFNSLNLNDGTYYIVEEIAHEESPKPDLNLQKIARTNASILLRKNYGVRTISAKIIVTDTTVAGVDLRLDLLKNTIEAIGKNLDIAYNGTTRRYVCTGFVEKVDRIPRVARVDVKFECYEAFGSDISTTNLAVSGKTTSPYTQPITILGSAPTFPDIQIAYSALNAGSGERWMKIKNINTGDYVQINSSNFVAGDSVVFSSKTATVLFKNALSQYLGIFPEWEPGSHNLEYSDNFISRQFNIYFYYTKRYL